MSEDEMQTALNALDQVFRMSRRPDTTDKVATVLYECCANLSEIIETDFRASSKGETNES